MVFWAWFFGAMLATFGMLSVLGGGQIAPMSSLPWLSYVLPILALAIWLLLVFWARPWRVWWQKIVLTVLAFICGAVLFASRTYWVYSQHKAQMIDTPIQVTATVQIFELSDSIYAPAYQLGYRQQAVLTDIAPVDEQIHSATQRYNPFYQNNSNDDKSLNPSPSTSSYQIMANATPLTVLLQTPKNHHLNFDGLAKIGVGKQAKMTLWLSPILPTQTATYAFDGYRFAMTRHLHANAQIVAIDEQSIGDVALGSLPVATKVQLGFERWRERFRLAFLQHWFKQDGAHQQAQAVTLSLLTGDRGLINRQTKDLYQYAGISHLLAISGTHVLFLAILLSQTLIWLINRYFAYVYCFLSRWQWRFLATVAVAFLYALFTGFEVPAVRTVMMLLAVGVARYLLLPWSAFAVLAMTALLMAWFDPYVLWQAGFWLSFVAVALLLRYEMSLDGHYVSTFVQAWRLHLIELIKLQSYIFVAMLPISILLFGKVSLMGLIVNVFAIGLFGYVIVPLNLLAGLLFVPLPMLAYAIWSLLSWILLVLAQALDVLSLLFYGVWLTLPVNGVVLGLGGLVFLLLGTKGNGLSAMIPKRWVWLPIVSMAMIMFGSRQSPISNKDNPISVHMLAAASPLSLTQALIIHDKMAWLVLGGETKPQIPFDDERLAMQLKSTMQAYGVRRLAGVVVQHDDQKLAKIAGQLSLMMPVEQLWWAGKAQTRFGKLVARPCVADAMIYDKGVTLMAMTGWQEIDDNAMHACSLWLRSDLPSMINFDFNDVKISDGQTQIILDATTKNEKLWQVWRLLCYPQDTPKPSHTTVLTLSYGVTDVVDLQVLNAKAVYFSNALTPKEQGVANSRYRLLKTAILPAD